MEILWVCLIGYMYSCTSVAIFLFKLFEVFNSIYFVKTGISLLYFNISSKKKINVVSVDTVCVLSLHTLVKEGRYSS